MLVGVYRVQEPTGTRQYTLSGHAVPGHVVFSMPFRRQGVIACWIGTLARDAAGLKLEFVRRLVGHGLDGAEHVTLDTFRRVAAEEAGAAAVSGLASDPAIGSNRA